MNQLLPAVGDRILSEWRLDDNNIVWWPGEVIACRKKRGSNQLVFKVQYDGLSWLDEEEECQVESHEFYPNMTLKNVRTREIVNWIYQARKRSPQQQQLAGDSSHRSRDLVKKS
jgi:hypothetical protein